MNHETLGGSMNILLVDDSELNLKLLGKFIETKKGFQSVMLSSGNNAVKAIEMASEMGITFDLIISDFFMKDGSGIVLYDFVKKTYPTIPFFLLTSADGKDLYNSVKGESNYLREVAKVLVAKPMTASKLDNIFESLEKI